LTLHKDRTVKILKLTPTALVSGCELDKTGQALREHVLEAAFGYELAVLNQTLLSQGKAASDVFRLSAYVTVAM